MKNKKIFLSIIMLLFIVKTIQGCGITNTTAEQNVIEEDSIENMTIDLFEYFPNYDIKKTVNFTTKSCSYFIDGFDEKDREIVNEYINDVKEVGFVDVENHVISNEITAFGAKTEDGKYKISILLNLKNDGSFSVNVWEEELKNEN